MFFIFFLVFFVCASSVCHHVKYPLEVCISAVFREHEIFEIRSLPLCKSLALWINAAPISTDVGTRFNQPVLSCFVCVRKTHYTRHKGKLKQPFLCWSFGWFPITCLSLWFRSRSNNMLLWLQKSLCWQRLCSVYRLLSSFLFIIRACSWR